MLTGEKKRAVLVLSFIAATTGLIFILIGPMSDNNLSKYSTGQSRLKLNNSDLKNYDKEGNLIWELEADRLTTDEQSDITKGTQVKLTFKREEEDDLIITAQEFTMNNQSQITTIEGKVKAVSNELLLTTESLKWDEGAEILESKERVNIRYKGVSMTGVGFEYSPSKDELTIREEAHLEVTGEENE